MTKKPYFNPAVDPLELVSYTVFCTSDQGVVVEGEDMDPWEDNDDNN